MDSIGDEEDIQQMTVDEYIDRIDIIEMKEILHQLSIFWVDKLVFLHYFEKKSDNPGYSFQQMGDECDYSPRKLSRKYEKVRGILYKWYGNRGRMLEKAESYHNDNENGQDGSLQTIHDK